MPSIKPHQQEVLDAFDAGEKNCQRLAERFDYTRAGVNQLLRRYGRVPLSRLASLEGTWTAEKRKAQSDKLRVLWAAGREALRLKDAAAKALHGEGEGR